MNTSEAVLDFRVPPQPHFARTVRDRVTEFARRHGVGEDDLSYFLTALGEALANAFEHARADGPIAVEVRVGTDRIVAAVQDIGVGFAVPATTATTVSLPAPSAERGRGLPIMRRCCDIFALTSLPGKGTAVVLGRYLRAHGSDAPHRTEDVA